MLSTQSLHWSVRAHTEYTALWIKYNNSHLIFTNYAVRQKHATLPWDWAINSIPSVKGVPSKRKGKGGIFRGPSIAVLKQHCRHVKSMNEQVGTTDWVTVTQWPKSCKMHNRSSCECNALTGWGGQWSENRVWSEIMIELQETRFDPVWRLHVLPVFTRVSFGSSCFFPHPKDMRIGELIGRSKLSLLCGCNL